MRRSREVSGRPAVSGTSMSSDALLEVRDLTVEIDTGHGSFRAVDGVSFDVPRGAALGLVGESGSGKSITLRALLGLLPPRVRVIGGTAHLDGEDLLAMSPGRLDRLRGPEIAMVFQEPMSALNPVMRVGEQIAEGPRVHERLGRQAARNRAIELMARVGIPDPARRYNAYPHEFSGGMRQRVMIAVALSCTPRLLLCDEPTTALDVTIQDQILSLLTRLCEENGTSLVFVTHDLAVVAQTCRDLAVLYAGRVVESGRVDEVFALPQHPYTLGLLRCAPDVDEIRDTLVPIPGIPPDPLALPAGCSFTPRCSFAREDCSATEVALRPSGRGRAVACLHSDDCVADARAEPAVAGV